MPNIHTRTTLPTEKSRTTAKATELSNKRGQKTTFTNRLAKDRTKWGSCVDKYMQIITIIIIMIMIRRTREFCSFNWQVTLKKSEQIDKYLSLARKLKKLWNMKVMEISIIFGVLGTVSKGLEKRLKIPEIRGCIETIQSTGLLKLARILRWVLETWGDLLSLRLHGKNYLLKLLSEFDDTL